jgi:type IV pilus assembly protein PilC
MPEFIAKIGTGDGTVMERSFSADSEGALLTDLRERDYHVFSIRKKSGLGALLPRFGGGRSINMKEFLLFNQELAALIRAGLPIVAGLDILLERRKNAAFRRALADVRDRVRGGAALSEAFDAQGDLFPKIFCSTLASGERSGEVANVLQRYIAYQKTILALRRRVIAALVYPACLFLISIVIIFIIITFVIPKFLDFYNDLGAELPLITRLLIGLSMLISKWLPALVVGAILFALAFRAWRQTPSGRLTLDRLKMRLPILGPIWERFAVTRFVRTLSTLLSGGIPMVTALGISARAVGNAQFEQELLRVEKKVREGGSLWQSLEETGRCSDIAIEMTKVGESTGSLHEMLENVSEFYDEEIETRLSTIMALLEPAMLIGMGVIVGAMLLAIYMPLLRSYAQSSF